MLTPHINDPKRADELKRKEKQPDTFGLPVAKAKEEKTKK